VTLLLGQRAVKVAIYNSVVARSEEIVSELFEILKFRGRSCHVPASVHAGEILLGLVGIRPVVTSEGTAGAGGINITHTGDGPLQVNNDTQTGPDRLTQELIDIVRKGNNGKGRGRRRGKYKRSDP